MVLDRYTVVEPHRTRTIYNWLQYYSPEAIEDEFARNGLRINELFSDVAGTPFDPQAAEFAVAAERL